MGRERARVNTSNPVWYGSVGVWVVFELYLVVRDRRRGKGSTAEDQGTRRLIVVTTAVTFVLGSYLARELRHNGAFSLSQGGMRAALVAGLAIFWAGLLFRVWSISVLGEAFRTTVEVDAGQRLVESGPYRFVRHPSYTGVIAMTTGFGILTGTWPAFLIAIICPTIVILRRIRVEERVLADTFGESYRAYAQRTWRLLPGVW